MEIREFISSEAKKATDFSVASPSALFPERRSRDYDLLACSRTTPST
jgi:hypothetical protein